MRALVGSVVIVAWVSVATAQESYKVAALKEAPPAGVSDELKKASRPDAFRIQDGQGKILADIWVRKAVPGSEKPSGPKEAVQFPFLADGEFLGVIRIDSEAHDYKDQPIGKGVYTMRYGVQPVNGDHLGVSTFRDYSLLLPVAKDQALALPPRKQLESKSAQAAGTSHPAVFLLLEAPAEASRSEASMIHDGEKNTWSVVLPLSVEVKGQSEPIAVPVRLVVVGIAAV